MPDLKTIGWILFAVGGILYAIGHGISFRVDYEKWNDFWLESSRKPRRYNPPSLRRANWAVFRNPKTRRWAIPGMALVVCGLALAVFG